MKAKIIFLSIGLFLGSIGCGKSSPHSEQVTPDTTASHIQIEKKKTVQEQVHRVLARVFAINEYDSTITVYHEKTEGYMKGMKMTYKVTDLSLLRNVRVGTEGHFMIKVTAGTGVITAIHVHKL